jgi:hypothetical protein
MIEEHELSVLFADEFFSEASFSAINKPVSLCYAINFDVEVNVREF